MSKLVLSLTALALSACVSVPVAPGMGDNEASTAPRLVESGKKDKLGNELLTWDRPGAFAKVSGNLKNRGDIACMQARSDLESIGYHSRAEDADGKTIPGGGYFCWTKANGTKEHGKAPKLVQEGDSIAWDRPSAFGEVSDSLKQRGAAVCSAIGNFVAIGYHSKARDRMGRSIEGGGFLCAYKPKA